MIFKNPKNFFSKLKLLMDTWLRNYNQYKYPNKQISNDAINLILQIVNNLNLNLQNVNIYNWIKSNLDSDIQEELIDKFVWAGPGRELEELSKYMASQILDLGYHETGNNILDEYYVLKGIQNHGLWESLKAYTPLFPLDKPRNGEYFVSSDDYERMGSSTDQFSDSLNGVINAVNNFYKGQVGEEQLTNFQNNVKNLILQRARQLNPNGELNFRDLIYSVYNNPDIANIPWKDVFTRALS
jgi:hypothetical protein